MLGNMGNKWQLGIYQNVECQKMQLIFDSIEDVLTFDFMKICNVVDHQDINFVAVMDIIR
jgi:hypothetical protein